MPRLLSPAWTHEKNQLASTVPILWLLQLDILGGPGAFRLANYDQDVTFHGLSFLRYPVKIEAVEEANSTALTQVRVTTGNVDQQLSSLLENYWASVPGPVWLVTLWQTLASVPNETPYEAGDTFIVNAVSTDFLSAQFELQAEGLTLTETLPKRRFTTTSGFPLIPRRI